jgi:hypothetical protein
MVSADAKGYMLRSIIQESLRQPGTCTAPINKVIADEHPICFRVSSDVRRVWATVGQAMVGICLAPLFCMGTPRIYVVTKGLLLASPQIGFLYLKSRIGPVLIESHRASDTHCVHDMFFTPTRFRSGPYYPVSNLRDAADSGLAGRKRANAEEGIRRKAVISGHDV